jgi:hypothetical protein
VVWSGCREEPDRCQRALAHLKREISEKMWAEARLEVLPVEDRELPRGPVPRIDEEPAYCQVLVVWVQNADSGARLQNCPWWRLQQKVLWAGYRRKRVGEETGSKSGISSPIRGVVERCLNSSPLRM